MFIVFSKNDDVSENSQKLSSEKYGASSVASCSGPDMTSSDSIANPPISSQQTHTSPHSDKPISQCQPLIPQFPPGQGLLPSPPAFFPPNEPLRPRYNHLPIGPRYDCRHPHPPNCPSHRGIFAGWPPVHHQGFSLHPPCVKEGRYSPQLPLGPYARVQSCLNHLSDQLSNGGPSPAISPCETTKPAQPVKPAPNTSTVTAPSSPAMSPCETAKLPSKVTVPSISAFKSTLANKSDVIPESKGTCASAAPVNNESRCTFTSVVLESMCSTALPKGSKETPQSSKWKIPKLTESAKKTQNAEAPAKDFRIGSVLDSSRRLSGSQVRNSSASRPSDTTSSVQKKTLSTQSKQLVEANQVATPHAQMKQHSSTTGKQTLDCPRKRSASVSGESGTRKTSELKCQRRSSGGDIPSGSSSSSKTDSQSTKKQTGKNSSSNVVLHKKKKTFVNSASSGSTPVGKSKNPKDTVKPSTSNKKPRKFKEPVAIRDDSPKFIPPEKPKKTSQSSKPRASNSLEIVSVQEKASKSKSSNFGRGKEKKQRRSKSGMTAATCSSVPGTEKDPTLKLPPSKSGKMPLLFGQIANVDSVAANQKARAAVPQVETGELRERESSEDVSVGAATGAASQGVPSSSAGSESTAILIESDSEETGGSAIDGPMNQLTGNKELSAEITGGMIDPETTPTPPPETTTHGGGNGVWGSVECAASSPATPLAPMDVEDGHIRKDSVSSAAGGIPCTRDATQRLKPTIDVQQPHTSTSAHPVPLEPLALPPAQPESDSDCTTLLPTVNSAAMSPLTNDNLQVLQSKIDSETAKLKLIALCRANDLCEGTVDTPASSHGSSDAATLPVCASKKNKKHAKITTTEPASTQSTLETSNSINTSTAPPTAVQLHLDGQTKSNSKLDSIITTLHSRNIFGGSRAGSSTKDSDSIVNSQTCASSESGVMEGISMKERKRKKSADARAAKKQRLGKAHSCRADRGKNGERTPQVRVFLYRGTSVLNLRMFTQEGAEGVSDPESKSVSSSQHSSSWDEGTGGVTTPHMKFASDIAALDRRDKELVSIYYTCIYRIAPNFRGAKFSRIGIF